MIPILAVAILIGLPIYLVKIFNRLRPRREEIREAEAAIETVMLKQRELAARLIEIAKAYGIHERDIHLAISKDRTVCQGQMSGSIGFMAGLVAGFPQLRADGTFLRLMGDLDRLAAEAQHYYQRHNAVARLYNSERSIFPVVLFSDLLGFGRVSYVNPAQWYPPSIKI